MLHRLQMQLNLCGQCLRKQLLTKSQKDEYRLMNIGYLLHQNVSMDQIGSCIFSVDLAQTHTDCIVLTEKHGIVAA